MSTPAPEPAAPTPEYVVGIAEGWWVCLCANEPHLYGFYASDGNGRVVDPSPDTWDGRTYVCRSCGRLIDPITGLVIGRRVEPFRADE
jgi:hypothetical protein